MQIMIRNYLAGSFLLEKEPGFWDVIVILDTGLSHTDFVAEHARRHIYLRFDDVDSRIRGKQPPTRNDILAAMEFARQSENLMVCCRAGQSRSAATAFVIACQRSGHEAAIQLLDPKRHSPNSLIIDLGAQVNDDPFVLDTFSHWQTANKQFRLSNYLDEIEREIDELERQGARNRIIRT